MHAIKCVCICEMRTINLILSLTATKSIRRIYRSYIDHIVTKWRKEIKMRANIFQGKHLQVKEVWRKRRNFPRFDV